MEKTQDKDIVNLASEIIKLHNFNYTSLSTAKKTVQLGNLVHCFDALSLCEYSSSLTHQQKDDLKSIYNEHYSDKSQKSPEDKKCRKEYESLFHFLNAPSCPYSDYKIAKETRPDFILTGNIKIGVEVVEFITGTYAVMAKIASSNFGKGKSTGEIYNAAKDKHGLKANDYKYFRICGTPAISPKGMTDVYKTQEFFAHQILTKRDKYKELVSTFDKFIVLCDARYTISVTSKTDCDKIMNMVNLEGSFNPNVTVCILYDGDEGLCVEEYPLKLV